MTDRNRNELTETQKAERAADLAAMAARKAGRARNAGKATQLDRDLAASFEATAKASAR